MQANVPENASLEGVQDERKLPVYLLLDTSGSMQGDPIRAVEKGLEVFKEEVCEDPFAREAVKVAVITFSTNAEMETNGLVPVADVQQLTLAAGGVTRLGMAFRKVRDSIDSDVVKPQKGVRRGDWKPIIFVLTDGKPTDEQDSDGGWRAAKELLVNPPKGKTKVACIVAVGCGNSVDDQTLKEISTGTAYRISGEETSFISLFQWLSQSISQSLQDDGNPEDPFSDMEPPSDLVRIP